MAIEDISIALLMTSSLTINLAPSETEREKTIAHWIHLFSRLEEIRHLRDEQKRKKSILKCDEVAFVLTSTEIKQRILC